MTQNQSTPPDPKPDQKMKGLLLQGLLGAVSLTGATAIPIVVQRALSPHPVPTVPAAVSPQPPTPAASPLPASVQQSPAVTVSPSPASVQKIPIIELTLEELQPPEENGKRRDKSRGKRKEDNDDDD